MTKPKASSPKAKQARKRFSQNVVSAPIADSDRYGFLVGGIADLLEASRRASARAVNVILTATYWEIGRRIVEFEQEGKEKAEYGDILLKRLGEDLSGKYGRGFGWRNLFQMRSFYLAYPGKLQTVSAISYEDLLPAHPTGGGNEGKLQTVSAKSCEGSEISETPSRISRLKALAAVFPLPWSAYVRLLSVKNVQARAFYETEALRNGWSVRQLDRQINSQFYERTALSRNKASMLKKAALQEPQDAVSPEEEIKDPYVLEFLNLKDEYSESDLEESLIRHLESFLIELGGDFCFVGRQKRLRIGDEWYRVDLLFFHRRLKCLVVIDLKLGKFTHADAGQMHTYLNYAAEHWTHPDENPPVGLILCAQKDEALARYALDNLPNKVLAAEYRTVLPDEKIIAEELEHTGDYWKNVSKSGKSNRGIANVPPVLIQAHEP